MEDVTYILFMESIQSFVHEFKTVHSNSIKNNFFRSSKSKENIHKKEDGPDCRVSDDKFSTVTLYNW